MFVYVRSTTPSGWDFMTAGRRPPLHGRDARLIEYLLGLRPFSLTGVQRRRNGDFALMFRTQRVGDRWPRVLRIPARRVFGYQQHSPLARDRDVRARRRANSRRFAVWLMWRLDVHAPIVNRALWRGDLSAVDELRDAILRLTPPDYVVLVWRRAA